jgi:hypothetical protein
MPIRVRGHISLWRYKSVTVKRIKTGKTPIWRADDSSHTVSRSSNDMPSTRTHYELPSTGMTLRAIKNSRGYWTIRHPDWRIRTPEWTGKEQSRKTITKSLINKSGCSLTANRRYWIYTSILLSNGEVPDYKTIIRRQSLSKNVHLYDRSGDSPDAPTAENINDKPGYSIYVTGLLSWHGKGILGLVA